MKEIQDINSHQGGKKGHERKQEVKRCDGAMTGVLSNPPSQW